MNSQELNEILQSDFKLWELADTAEEDGVVSKTLSLPHGIGEYTLRFEGINSADKRRAAATLWGESIRSAVADAISEESVTARAAQRAAYRVEDDDRESDSSESSDREPAEVSGAEAVPSSSEDIDSIGADPANRLDALRGAIGHHEKRLRELRLEVKALEAYMEVINAQKVYAETNTDQVSED